MWHLPREVFDLAIESLNKAQVIAAKEIFKWEISIKMKLASKLL